jgi:hypothetical protein
MGRIMWSWGLSCGAELPGSTFAIFCGVGVPSGCGGGGVRRQGLMVATSKEGSGSVGWMIWELRGMTRRFSAAMNRFMVFMGALLLVVIYIA